MVENDSIQFILDDLVKWDILGITKTLAQNFVDACLICLDNQNHYQPITLNLVENKQPQNVEFIWNQPLTDQIRRTWRDLYEATEYGATGLAILLVIQRTSYTILERSVRGMGFDYWLLDKESAQSSELITQGNARLEISGILRANTESVIQSRIKEKLNQVALDTTFPTLIIVVEFSRPEVHMVWKHELNS
ncbi:MAG: hypothetical protein MUE54_02685 [Anaerolineae bacterium]|nr:hypothetical protein [Anaerolineae bacterium]